MILITACLNPPSHSVSSPSCGSRTRKKTAVGSPQVSLRTLTVCRQGWEEKKEGFLSTQQFERFFCEQRHVGYVQRSPHTLSPLHTCLRHVRERRKTAEGGGVQLDPQLHACMRLFPPPCPIDNSAWAVCKISGVQQCTPEVSLKQPDKLPVRCVPAQAGNRPGGVRTSPGHPELCKVRIFFLLSCYFSIILGKAS